MSWEQSFFLCWPFVNFTMIHDSMNHICVKSDSATAAAYINRIGGSVLSLLEETKNIWNWRFSKSTFISAGTFREENNKIPDYLSREFNDWTEWMLTADVLNKLCRSFFKPKIDLFASRLNTQIPDNYVSWFPDPIAVEFDAFSLLGIIQLIHIFFHLSVRWKKNCRK